MIATFPFNNHLLTDTVADGNRPICRLPHLHGGEVPLLVKDKLHLYVSLSAQRVVLPAQVVVARQDVVLTSHQEVVQADHAVRQLAHPPKKPPARRRQRSDTAGVERGCGCECAWASLTFFRGLHRRWSH